MPSDLELLEVEIRTLWRPGGRGHIVEELAPLLVLAVSRDGWTLAFGKDVTDDLAVELRGEVAAQPPSDPAARPEVMARCEELLRDSIGPTDLSSGPSYVIPVGTAFEPAADLLRSSEASTGRLAGQDIERLNWQPDEWRDLLKGKLGPWAMAVVNSEVIAICFSARLTAEGAEAGVWTAPDFRGQGHAASVTAAWARLLEDSGRALFYSTAAANQSSQRVAARLGLRPIGWMWKLTARPTGD